MYLSMTWLYNSLKTVDVLLYLYFNIIIFGISYIISIKNLWMNSVLPEPMRKLLKITIGCFGALFIVTETLHIYWRYFIKYAQSPDTAHYYFMLFDAIFWLVFIAFVTILIQIIIRHHPKK